MYYWFNFGEIVQPRSSGPEMTVANIIDGENPGQWKMYVIRWKAEKPSASVWHQTQWFEAIVQMMPQSLFRYRPCDENMLDKLEQQIDSFEKDTIYGFYLSKIRASLSTV